MEITFYKFYKRENSTLKPSDDTGNLTYDVMLKDACTIITPVIKILPTPLKTDHLFEYNYCYIPTFDRYYFITNWEFAERCWYAYMTVDVLASQRTNILTSTQYVQRSSTLFDTDNYNDATYPPKLDPEIITQDISGFFVPFLGNNGCYIVGIIGAGDVSSGSVSYYYFTPAGLTAFNKILLGSTDYMQLTEGSQVESTTAKLIANPFDYISSCRWYPFTLNVQTSAQSVKLGWWTINNVSCRSLDTPAYQASKWVQIVKHPASSARGNYLNYAPWTMMEMLFEPFGSISLPVDLLATYGYINMSLAVDCISGKAVLLLGASKDGEGVNIVFAELSTQVGTDVPLAQTSGGLSLPAFLGVAGATGKIAQYGTTLAQRGDWLSQTGGGILQALGNAGSILTQIASNNIGSLFGGILNGTTLDPTATVVEKSGAQGSFAGFFSADHINYTFLIPADENVREWGRPLNRLVVLGQLSGFCKCTAPDYKGLNCTIDETIAVNKYLAMGVFLE